MKYRLMNPDGSPTTLVYDDLFRATYMVNMLSHWTQTHLGIQSEEGEKENVTSPDKVEALSTEEQRRLSREELNQRARTVSNGGTRPDNMTREEWRTSQGSYYDDDRC